MHISTPFMGDMDGGDNSCSGNNGGECWLLICDPNLFNQELNK